jgi:transcriptional regulator with XRE-family HTH domain
MLSILPKNPHDVMQELRDRFKARRLTFKYTQKELSTRSGVSLGSLKRFESSGQISLESLLKLALVLECLGDFEGVCGEREEIPKSIEDLL